MGWIMQPSKKPPISELGFDVLTELPSQADFQSGIKYKNVSIKGFLLDQVVHLGRHYHLQICSSPKHRFMRLVVVRFIHV
jgi:formamidopyrimidine-DNA glycosylase